MNQRRFLVELRGDKSISQIAKELNITPQMLGAIEKGNRTPSLNLAEKIADYYNSSLDDIFLSKKDTKRVYLR